MPSEHFFPADPPPSALLGHARALASPAGRGAAGRPADDGRARTLLGSTTPFEIVRLRREGTGTFHLDERLPNSLPCAVGDVSRDPPGRGGAPPGSPEAGPETDLVPTAFTVSPEALLP